MGQPGDTVRPPESRGPVRDAGQSGSGPDREDRPPAGHRLDGRPRVGLGRRADATLHRAECPRRDDHGGTRLPHADRDRGVDQGPVLLPLRDQ